MLSSDFLANENFSFFFIIKFGFISSSFWRYPLNSVRWKALGKFYSFTLSSNNEGIDEKDEAT